MNPDDVDPYLDEVQRLAGTFLDALDMEKTEQMRMGIDLGAGAAFRVLTGCQHCANPEHPE